MVYVHFPTEGLLGLSPQTSEPPPLILQTTDNGQYRQHAASTAAEPFLVPRAASTKYSMPYNLHTHGHTYNEILPIVRRLEVSYRGCTRYVYE